MRLSVRKRLLLLVLGVALPLVAITALVVFNLASTQRDIQRANLLVNTRTVAALVDAELETYISLGYTLSRLSSLVRGDIENFYIFAKESAARWPASSVILATADGKQVFNTEYPFGQTLPDVAHRVFFDKAIQTFQMQISDLYQDQATNKYAVSIYVPVTSQGRSTHCIVVAVDVKTFERLLIKQQLPPGWISAVIDGKGVLIARNPGHDRFVGKLSRGKWKDLAKITNEASFESVSLEGDPNYSTLVNSKLSNWSSSVAAAQNVVMAPFQTSFAILFALSLCAVGISFYLAYLLSKKITTPLIQLEKASLAMKENEPLSFNPTELPEVDSALAAFKSASDHIAQRDEEQRKYIRMLDSGFDAIIVRDPQDRITGWNRGAEKLYGWTREEALGQVTHSLFQTKFPKPLDEILADTLRNTTWEGELIHTRKDGARITVFSRWTLELDAQGQRRFILETNIDITERIAAEERFHLAIEAAPNGMLLATSEGRIVLVNAQIEKMFGYSRDELIGQKVEMLVPARLQAIHPNHRANYMAKPSVRLMGAGRDLFARRKDGTEVPVEIGLSPITTTHGTMVLSAVVDITDRKLAQDSQQLVIRELKHRTQNVLTIVQTIANRSVDEAKTFAEAKYVMNGRLNALAQAYRTLADAEWVGAYLREIIDRQLAVMSNRVSVSGCDVVIIPSAAQQFAMTVHELTTNSLKYGALSTTDGHVSIEGKIDRGDKDGMFSFVWKETGGPVVSPPSRKGFGSVILFDAANHFAENVTADYLPAGLVYSLKVRLSTIEVIAS